MTSMYKSLRLIATLLLVAGTVAACDNTIRGVGQDVEDTGAAIEDAAS